MTSQVLTPESLLQSASSVESDDWSSLPVIDEENKETEQENTPPDRQGMLSVEPGYCWTCGELIVREPGARGRIPKYHPPSPEHPDCRPSGKSGASAPRVPGVSKQEKESDRAVALLEPYVMQLAMAMSFVDQFDAYTILVGWPGVRDNLRGLMVRYDWLREEVLAISTGGSVLGLVLSILMIALPISAHHGLMGKGKPAEIMQRAPFMLSRMQERMAQGIPSVKEFLESELRSKMAPRNATNGRTE